MKNFKKIFNPNKLSTFLLYFSTFTFIIAFNFSDNPSGGWYQQFLPNLNGRSISDMTFLDSLTGFAVTNNLSPGDTGYILKTTNGGDNWKFSFIVDRGFTAIQFVNLGTGYACGGSSGGTTYLCKTTDAGLSWFPVNCPSAAMWRDMSVLNNDTLWLVDSDGLTGGVFRTTNVGVNWTHQLNLGSQNPSHIYMFNGRIGFTSTGNGTYKTTNSGRNWFSLPVTSFSDIYFSDSLTGWKNNEVATFFQKTTDGGLNWTTYNLPPEQGPIVLSRIISFSNMTKDTIWGAGSVSISGRALIYKSTNSEINFGYQTIDSTINIFQFQHIQFINKSVGWVYTGSKGVHTTIGGNDTTYYPTSINQIVSTIPSDYKLYQNYPNPFNPLTKIKYELKVQSFVKLRVFNIEGREVKTIVNEKQNAGVYEADFSATEYGSSLSSGVYFYSLLADDRMVDTKKMIVVK